MNLDGFKNIKYPSAFHNKNSDHFGFEKRTQGIMYNDSAIQDLVNY
jgi:hypothetical protein